MLLEPQEVTGVDHPNRVSGRSTDTYGEPDSVKRLIVIVIIAVLAIAFVQPIRAYRNAQQQLASARSELVELRAIKQRAVSQRDALGTREMLVREARRRGFIFPGETPYSVGDR